MGFDAIWISPVVDNTDCGYHGYWAQKQFEIESHFGGAQQLSELMMAAKAAGVAVMLDIVVNHMGPPQQQNSYPEFSPFNSTDHYHGTLASHCQLPPVRSVYFKGIDSLTLSMWARFGHRFWDQPTTTRGLSLCVRGAIHTWFAPNMSLLVSPGG